MTKAEELKYCRNGDPQGMHAKNCSDKIRAKNIKSITDEEFQALIDKNWALLNKGVSNGSF